jgi:hypothetical protein
MVRAPAHDHEHDLDVGFLSARDAQVLGLSAVDDELRLAVAVPCPECDQTLELDAGVDAITEVDLELPLEDVEEHYD